MFKVSDFDPGSIYSRITVLLMLLCLIAPFVHPYNLMAVFVTGPRLWFYLITGLLLVMTAVKLIHLKDRIAMPAVTAADILLVLTLIYLLARQYCLHHPVFFTDKLTVYCCLTFLYLILRVHISSVRKISLKGFTLIFAAAVLLITLVLCCYGLLQLYQVLDSNNDNFKVTGPFYNPARYANYLVALLPFSAAAYFLFPEESRYGDSIKYAALAVCLTGILVLPVTYTRAAWVGMCAALVVILFYKYKRHVNQLVNSYRSIILFIVAAAGILFLLYKLKPASASGRLLIWEVSMDIVKDHPITGIGYGNFEGRYGLYQARYFGTHDDDEQKVMIADVVRYPYNLFLQVLCEQGLIGLMLFVLLCFFIVRRGILSEKIADKYERYIAAASFSSLISILVCGQASYPFDILPVLIVFFISTGLLMATNNSIQPEKQLPGLNRRWLNPHLVKSFAPLLLACAALLFNETWTKLNAYKRWPLLSNSGSEECVPLYGTLKDDIDFLNFYSKKLLDEKKYNTVITELSKSSHLLTFPSFYLSLAEAYAAVGEREKAEGHFKIAADMVPNRFYSRYLWLKFYEDTHQWEKAGRLSESILTMKIKVPSKAVDEIRAQTLVIRNKMQERLWAKP